MVLPLRGQCADSVAMLSADGLATPPTLLCRLHGSYLLTESLLPRLAASADPRVVLVSSGGMYLGKWPGAAAASFAEPEVEGVHAPYAGNTAYCYSKRAQVLLADEWRQEHGETTGIKFVSCHPGWVATPGVEGAFGDKQKWLEPMRTTWEGSEGTCVRVYMCMCTCTCDTCACVTCRM